MPPKKKGRKAAQVVATTKKSSPPLNLTSYFSSMQDYRNMEWIRTGIHSIDLIIGDGIPRGRFIEVIGDPGTAKSAFAYVVIGAFQRAGGDVVLMDSESKTDKAFAEKLGVDWSKLGYPHVENINTCVQILAKTAKMADAGRPTLVVWDSLASTRGVDELDDAASDEGMGMERGQRAKAFSSLFRAVLGDLSTKGVTLLGINQLRTNFNFASGYTTLESPGGKAIKYHAAVRMIMKPRGRIRDKVRDIITGQVFECECIKNQVSPPFRKAMLQFKFDTGFVHHSGLDELLLRHGRILQKAGWLCFKDKSFRGAELERMLSEMPELIAPLRCTVEEPVATAVPTEHAPEEAGMTVETTDDED